jgi:hypothetical protein
MGPVQLLAIYSRKFLRRRNPTSVAFQSDMVVVNEIGNLGLEPWHLLLDAGQIGPRLCEPPLSVAVVDLTARFAKFIAIHGVSVSFVRQATTEP